MVATMYKKVVFIGVGLLVLATGNALAAKSSNVSKTIHNLSSDYPFDSQYATNEDEVCIFCHTPHGGNLNGPLWNHDVPGASSFTHYSSNTLDFSTAANTGRAVNDESLICLSCHDGSIAATRVINASNDIGQPDPINTAAPEVFIQAGFGVPGPRIGGSPATPGGTGDLSDDHPISFSMQESYDVESGAGGSNGLKDPAVVAAAGNVRLFGGPGVYRVECSSCHDPHVDYDTWFSATADPAYDPFLIYPNTGSQLCLECHVK